jgi:predicted RNA-binding Zn-ribbon protein involved in translation (DUF1610 family)
MNDAQNQADEHGVTATQESGGGMTYQPIPSTDFGCPKCGRTFASAPALRMHTVRAHGKGWDTSPNFGKGGKKRTKAEELAKRRIYQAQLRERYYAQGRDSKGRQRPPGWKPNPHRRAAALKRRKSPSYSATLTGAKREAYLAKQREYHRNHYAKQKAQREAKWAKAEAVYKDAPQKAAPKPNTQLVAFCPKCGTNIRVVEAALRFTETQ